MEALVVCDVVLRVTNHCRVYYCFYTRTTTVGGPAMPQDIWKRLCEGSPLSMWLNGLCQKQPLPPEPHSLVSPLHLSHSPHITRNLEQSSIVAVSKV